MIQFRFSNLFGLIDKSKLSYKLITLIFFIHSEILTSFNSNFREMEAKTIQQKFGAQKLLLKDSNIEK